MNCIYDYLKYLVEDNNKVCSISFYYENFDVDYGPDESEYIFKSFTKKEFDDFQNFASDYTDPCGDNPGLVTDIKIEGLLNIRMKALDGSSDYFLTIEYDDSSKERIEKEFDFDILSDFINCEDYQSLEYMESNVDDYKIFGYTPHYYIGTNGNFYHRILYTYEEAESAIKTLKNCQNCINCDNLNGKSNVIFNNFDRKGFVDLT